VPVRRCKHYWPTPYPITPCSALGEQCSASDLIMPESRTGAGEAVDVGPSENARAVNVPYIRSASLAYRMPIRIAEDGVAFLQKPFTPSALGEKVRERWTAAWRPAES